MDKVISLIAVLQTHRDDPRRSPRRHCAMKAARAITIFVTLTLLQASLSSCTLDCKAVLCEHAIIELNRVPTIENAHSGGIFGRFRPRSGPPNLELAISDAAAILHLTPDATSTSVLNVRNRLDQLDQQVGRIAQGSYVEASLARGQLLRGLPPSANNTLNVMQGLPQKREQNAPRPMIVTHLVASTGQTRWYLGLIYAIPLVVGAAFLVHLGIRLMSRAIAPQPSSTLAHVIAGMSIRFINTRPQDIDKEIDRAITDLAACIGSSRAYFVMSGSAPRLHLWHKPGLPPPHGWPVGAVQLAAQMENGADGVIHIPRVSRAPIGEHKARCLELGLGGWACATTSGRDNARLVLGFDMVGNASLVKTHGELALLRTALDGIAQVVERHGIEIERARLEARLQKARRFEKIGILTSDVAHDFNNILGGILGHSEIMEERASLDVRSTQNLAAIRRGAERARDLVDQMRAFGCGRDAHRELLSISALIAETASLLCVSLPQNIEVVIRQPSVAAMVYGENASLPQIIRDLCDEAALAMHEGGRIEIATELHDVSDALALSHDEIRPGRYVCITVTNTGKGMDEIRLGRIFEPFFATRSSGNCLGLATVREIIQEHRGRMNVQSEPNKGSRIDIWLPRATAASASPPRGIAFPNGRDKTVMLVALDRERVQHDEEMLAALGYEPIGFTNAEAALAACRANSNRFDMAVVGHFGRTTRSLEFAAALHAAAPRLPIVLASRAIIELRADTLVTAGIADVVGWPIVAEEIAIALAHSSTHAYSEDRRRH
jgi:signal transduction histidine kinase